MDAPDASDETRGFNRPAMRVLDVRVTTSYDTDGRPVRTPLEEGGSSVVMDVPLSGSIAIRFDRFVLPHKVTRQAICLRPGTETVTSIADCANPGQPLASVEYNPVLRTAFYRLPEGEQLSADTRYRLTIFTTDDVAGDGFFAYDGAALAQTYVFDFQTASDATTASVERLPTKENYCEAVRCFEACMPTDAACRTACRPLCVDPTCFQSGDLLDGATAPTLLTSCAFGECHAAGSALSDMPDPSVIAMGLDLFTRDGIRDTAIGKTAHQTQTGEGSVVGDQSPDRFGRAMPIVDPSNPGNSYLLYKALVNPLNFRRTDEGLLADAFGNAEPDFAFEIDRLRDSVVVGLPMPATQSQPSSIYDLSDPPDTNGALALERMLLLNAWIAHGAVTTCEGID